MSSQMIDVNLLGRPLIINVFKVKYNYNTIVSR